MSRAAGARLGRATAAAVAALLALLTVAGCTETAPPDPVDPVSPSATPRQFLTLGTVQRPTQLDPAGVTEPASAGVVVNVFQRLMTVPPGTTSEENPAVLKPEAARDCQFVSPVVYECDLNPEMSFHNGHPLTASDVKFSIERALRLDVEGSSVALLDTLRRIETPDELTVRFVLNRPDYQFGFALAAPAASIVDEELYDPDELRPLDLHVVGSGPYRISEQGEEQVRFDRFAKYVGPTPGAEQTLLMQTYPDPGSLEQAMIDGEVDAVWQGLSSAAVTRVRDQIEASTDQRSDAGFSELLLPGARVLRLRWSPDSPARPDADVRQAVSAALQGERTLDSIVPPTIAGYVSSFAVGGQPSPKEAAGRTTLVLSHPSTMLDGADVANVLRSRIEAAGDLSVRVQADAEHADLYLSDDKAWTPTALAWLQTYTDAPAVGSTVRVEELTDRYRASTDADESLGLLSELQKQAAADAVVLPVQQADEPIYLAEGTTWDAGSFGPGWQLGLWGLRRV